jgi:hypothetical protein
VGESIESINEIVRFAHAPLLALLVLLLLVERGWWDRRIRLPSADDAAAGARPRWRRRSRDAIYSDVCVYICGA